MLPAASPDALPRLASTRPHAMPSPLLSVGLGSAAIFLLCLVDALLRPPGALDLRTMQTVQRLDVPHLNPFLETLDLLTDSAGAVTAWAAACVLCLVARWWLPLFGFLALPAAGLVNEGIGRILVTRTRPHLAELVRRSENFEERSFPSGHVVGAVVFYGFVWFLVGRVRSRPLRWAARLLCGVVIFLTGLDRVWGGAHWPSDVVAAYALGAGLLVTLIAGYRWAETVSLAPQLGSALISITVRPGRVARLRLLVMAESPESPRCADLRPRPPAKAASPPPGTKG